MSGQPVPPRPATAEPRPEAQPPPAPGDEASHTDWLPPRRVGRPVGPSQPLTVPTRSEELLQWLRN